MKKPYYEKIAGLRRMYNISQQRMADFLDMNLSTYQIKEKKGGFKCEQLIIICKIFETDANTLLLD